MKTLKRYWFTFPRSSRPTALNIGCGVTAYTYGDAVNLLRERVFGGMEPNFIGFKENVDVGDLDKSHVIPNMGLVIVRGVWFPLGYDE
jgi:hypothetical protein